MAVTSGWPAVAYESVPWDVSPTTGTRRLAHPGQPYRAALVPAIAEVEAHLTSSSAALAEEAAGAAARFDAEAGRRTAPFAAILLRSESAASSQIEHLSASARRIAEAEVTGTGTEHAELIVANARAMSVALERAAALDAPAILKIHDTLMRPRAPQIAGRWRADQVWIGGRAAPFGASSPHGADFVPPVAARVPAAIDDLVRFSRRDDLPAIAHTALVHAQFETIHPFPDGNGRTGRAVMHAMLRRKGITAQTSIPVSAGLLTDTRGYFQALTDFRLGIIDPIVVCVAEALIMGVDRARTLIADLDTVQAEWQDRLEGVRAHSGARRLADGLLRYPVISVAEAREILHATNAHRHLDMLVSRGILIPHQDYKSRNMTWRAPDVLAALDRFAEGSRRRRS